jgi:hypothetical protein
MYNTHTRARTHTHIHTYIYSTLGKKPRAKVCNDIVILVGESSPVNIIIVSYLKCIRDIAIYIITIIRKNIQVILVSGYPEKGPENTNKFRQQWNAGDKISSQQRKIKQMPMSAISGRVLQ